MIIVERLTPSEVLLTLVAAKDDIVRVGLGRGAIHTVAEGVEEATTERFARILTYRDVVSEPSRADITICCDICHVVAPKADDVILVVPVPAVFERHTDLIRTLGCRQRRITVRVTVVPNLYLLDLIEIVASIESYHFHVWLREFAVRTGSTSKQKMIR